jgi:transcription elongation factor Elf1
MIEEDYDFVCPYCGAENSVRLDATSGSKQSFVQDCTTCCKPIQISVQFENGELVDFSAEGQD